MLIVTLHQHMGPADPTWNYSTFNCRSKQDNVHIKDPIWEDHILSPIGFQPILTAAFAMFQSVEC